MQNTNTHTQEGPAVDVGSGALLGWIYCSAELPKEGELVECMWDMDDSVSTEEMTFRHTGRPTDYGYTPGQVCLPEGVYRWRRLPNT